MDLWKNKVAAKFKLLLGGKKVVAEANKHLDESKEEWSKEVEEKREELKPKVIGLYEASSTEIKTLIKEPNVSGLKKHSTKVQKFLDELVTIDFPGSKAVSEASSKYGPVLVSGSVIFVFEKVSTFISEKEEEKEKEKEKEKEVEKENVSSSREVEIPTEAAVVAAPGTTTTTTTTTTTVVAEVEGKVAELEKAVVVELEKAVETATKVEAPKPEEAPKPK